MIKCMLLLAGWLSLPLMAAPDTAPDLDLLQWLFSSLLVIGVLLLFAWLLKRSRMGMGRNQVIRLHGMMMVGNREKVILVQVGQQQYLLGVTPQQITLLDKLKQPLDITTDNAAMPTFSSELLKVLGRNEKN